MVWFLAYVVINQQHPVTFVVIIHFVALERRETLDNLQQLIIKTEFKKMQWHRMDLLPMCWQMAARCQYSISKAFCRPSPYVITELQDLSGERQEPKSFSLTQRVSFCLFRADIPF